MVDKKSIKNSTIIQQFQIMGYGDEEENVAEAIEWLKTKNKCFYAYIDNPTEEPKGEVYSLKYSYRDEILCNIYVPQTDTVQKIYTKSKTTNKWITLAPLKRAELMRKFANEIKKRRNLLTQLEVVARGILSKETRNKPLALLTEYLQFYSGFTTMYTSKNSKRFAVGIISDSNCVSSLGCILGPALACGYNVILQTGYQLTVITALLIDIAHQVGIPEGTIKLQPGLPNNLKINWICEPHIITIFDDIYKKKYEDPLYTSLNIINFYSSGIPMLVFDNCDLDSACQSIVEAAWGCKGLLPWSVRKILVQESIFEKFVKKLKTIVDNISVGSSNKKNVDITYPEPEVLEKITSLTHKARNEGVEVYHPTSKPYPVLLIGGIVFSNNVIKEDTINVPIVTLIAFRSINEAVALANNTRQGLAASVWTESTSLAHEIVRKLKVANIWVNSHGLFTAELSNSPYKNIGKGHFGGKDGLHEYFYPPDFPYYESFLSSDGNGELMEKAVTEAKKAQESWHKLKKLERIQFLQTVVQDISTKKIETVPDEWVNEWISLTYEFTTLNVSEDGFNIRNNFNVVSMREPCGTIAVDTQADITTHKKKLILTGLAEGNSVIILNDSKEANIFYSLMSALLPKGVLTVLPASTNIVNVALHHKELNVYFMNFEFCGSLCYNKRKSMTGDDWGEIYKDVTLSKNVWFNVGQSFN